MVSVRSVFPPRAVIQSATPADRTSRRSSSVVLALACERARACACESVAQCAAGAGVLVCGRGTTCGEEEEKTAGRKEGVNPEQENSTARALRGHRGWW